uniref:Uncharacterized protein n=1 Tax=Anguilla anguilla TaxID=7936 RepID=A0A0E9UEW7_ANGAN
MMMNIIGHSTLGEKTEKKLKLKILKKYFPHSVKIYIYIYGRVSARRDFTRSCMLSLKK